MSSKTVTRRPAAPEVYHARNHRGEFGTCWQCQRARAICRSKLSFDSWDAAEANVQAMNAERGYQRPVQRYPCRWCPGWHMKTARKKHDVKRAEKHRRKWLIGQLVPAPSGAYAADAGEGAPTPADRSLGGDAPPVQPGAAVPATPGNELQRDGTT